MLVNSRTKDGSKTWTEGGFSKLWTQTQSNDRASNTKTVVVLHRAKFYTDKFKNKDVIEFCGSKGIKREYSNARTPQQNGVDESQRNGGVLVTKPHNKTPYELLTGKGPTWLFDLDYLTDSMNYHHVRSENQANIHAGQQEANHHAGTKDIIDAGDSENEDESAQDCFVLPIWPSYSSKISPNLKTNEKREGAEAIRSNNFGPPIIEDWDSDDESEIESTPNKTDRPSIEQVKMNQSTREIVEKKESSKQNKNHPRGNQRNWNNQKSQQLGKDFVMQNKACYNCGSFEHLKFDCKQNIWVDKGKTWSRVNHDHDNMKYPSKPTLNCAHSKMTSLVEPAHSHVKRPFVRKTAVKNKVWVPTVRTKFPTVGPKVPTAKPTVAADKGNRGKAIKASTCWIWKPKQNQPDQGSNLNGILGIPHDNIDDKGYWDSDVQNCSTNEVETMGLTSDPSSRPSSSIPIPDSNSEGFGGNHGAQAAEIKDLKAQIKQLKKKTRPIINHHKAWFRAARLKKQQTKTNIEKSKKRRSVSKQGRKAVKSSKGAPSVHTHTDWDAMDTNLEATLNDAMDYTQDGDTLVVADKGSAKKGGSTKGTDLQQSTVKPDEGESDTPTNKLKQKEKGVELKNVEDIERPRPASTRSLLTLKPFPKIDPKAKGKGKIEEEDESDTESEDINEAEKKIKMLANDEEMARKARLNADKILAEKLQEEEREKFTIEERAKLLHDTIAAQRRFLAQQRSKVIRNKLPSRTQLRNLMTTYLKHVGGKKHSDLKTKNFEEIQVLYEKVKRSDENFISIGSIKDERLIKDLNKKAASKDDSIKQETSDEDKEIDYEILDKKYPIIEWKSEYLGNKPQYDETKDLEEINLNVVIRSNGQRRYQDEIPKGVHTLMTEAGLVIHMLVEEKYHLRKKVLLQMLELKLESEEDNTMALELIRFVKKLIAELEPENSDGDEEDL
ncbi:ribonuclease H-like domain-containing protein [Tanacetum coccineum]